MKILVISAKNKTIFNFRGDLIKDMISHGNEVYVTGPNTDFVDEIMDLGIKQFIEIRFVKDNTSIFTDTHYLFSLIKTIKKIKPDIVFSYNIKPVIYGSIAAKCEKSPHIFAMVTGLGRIYSSDEFSKRIIRHMTKILYTIAFKCCEKVIFQNRDDIVELLNAGYLKVEKVSLVNGSGVNMDRFVKTDLPEKPVFLMVSRLIREKGVLEYCEAARELKKKHSEVRCILLGAFEKSFGALQPKNLQEYIDDGSIELQGEVKDPVPFYNYSSVYVLPSYYREGIPRTILEAMACGRPVITTDWVGCREPIEDGINGYLVPIRDSNTLLKKMKILCDYEKAIAMGNAAYLTCRERFEVSIINEQMRNILKY